MSKSEAEVSGAIGMWEPSKMKPFSVSLTNRDLERHDAAPATPSSRFDRLTQNGLGVSEGGLGASMSEVALPERGIEGSKCEVEVAESAIRMSQPTNENRSR